MAIPVVQFQPETFAQANPFLTGLQAGQQIFGQGVQNAFLPQMLRQQLLQAQLNNQILQPQAQYAPQMTQAELAFRQAQAPNMQAQTQEILQGKIPEEQAQAGELGARSGLEGAQTQSTYAMIPYIPMQMQAKYLSAIGGVMRNAPIVNAIRMQNNPAFQQMVSNNPDLQAKLAGAMQSTLNNQIVLPSITGLPGMSPAQNQSPYMQQTTQQMPQMTSQQMNFAPQASSAQQSGNVSTPFGSVSLSDANNLGTGINNALMKTLYTPQQMQQLTYEASAENMLKQLDMPSIASFAGLAGQANQSADKFAASMGMQTSPEYQKFVNFTRVQAPAIANELRRSFGGQATDSEREVMDNLANPVYWNKNPQIALNQFQSIINTLQANAKALTQPKLGNLQEAQNFASNPMQIPGANPQAFTTATPSSGMAAPIKIPAFRSKQDFQNWYSVLPPGQKVQVRAQLGGQ